eukprot:TRINITY_DN1216_c0_g1_i2.p1 TRINITY_DN1216_c0_g1~~TRINITY_DN1216_c0_g1_i2.p1  ORF type:complete len:116 (-),score=2.40 TRINITY_DN1216_c0_g1_i2:2-349(-)
MEGVKNKKNKKEEVGECNTRCTELNNTPPSPRVSLATSVTVTGHMSQTLRTTRFLEVSRPQVQCIMPTTKTKGGRGECLLFIPFLFFFFLFFFPRPSLAIFLFLHALEGTGSGGS